MSDDKQSKEVKDEELDKVSGGHGTNVDAGRPKEDGGHIHEDGGGHKFGTGGHLIK